MAIVGNTIALFSDRYPISDKEVTQLDLANNIFLGIFLGEMVTKILGFGIKHYLIDRYNFFDAFVILISIVDLILTTQNNSSVQSALTTLRALRFLRIFKIARRWRSL